MTRTIIYGAAITFGVLTILLVSGFVYRAYCQNKNAQELKIESKNGINEEMFIKAGGIDQWVQIRGENRDNPVLLILHGGPGFSYISFTQVFRSWEKEFTIVQWDQRGTGKTFGKNGKTGSGPMSIEKMSADGVEVAEFLRKHLKKEKIVLFAHSWGTILGIPMISKRPDLFFSYVGTGQIVDMPRSEKQSYELILNHVKASGDEKAIKTLTDLGPPPYQDLNTWMIKGRLAVMFTPPSASGRTLPNVFGAALTSPSYSLKDGYDVFSAFDFSSRELYSEMMVYDARRFGTKFKVPIFILQGDMDLQAPTSLAQEYFASVEAPNKEFVLLKGEGHTAVLILPDVFLKELIAHVLPIAR